MRRFIETEHENLTKFERFKTFNDIHDIVGDFVFPEGLSEILDVQKTSWKVISSLKHS